MGTGKHPPDDRAGLFTGLSRNVVVLSWVSFFQDAASEMLYPVLPLFLTGVLGAPPSVVGLIEGVAGGRASVMKAVSGRLADIRRRRPLVAAGYGISSLSKLIIGFATGWPLVLVARFADRFGKGLRTSPRDALIAADTAPEHRGRAFGFNRALDTAGAVVGPLAGLALYDRVPRRIVFATGLGIFAAAYIGLGAVTSAGWVWFLLPLYGGYTALTDGVGKAWVADLLPEERVGSGLGFYQGLAGGAALLAGVWAGLAWGSSGRLPLLVSGVVVAGLAGVLLVAGDRLERGGVRSRVPA